MKTSNKTTNPPSPAELPQPIRLLARCSLRDAADIFLSALSLSREDAEGCTGDDLRLFKDLAERASDTVHLAGAVIAQVLLMLWRIAPDYEDARCGLSIPPWQPVGALIENRWFLWITPGEEEGKPNYEANEAHVQVIDNEALENENMSDEDFETLLSRPPCRYVVLGMADKAAVVVKAAATL